MIQRLIQFGSGPTRGVFGIMLFSKNREGGMSFAVVSAATGFLQ